jgi:hypothetical protein
MSVMRYALVTKTSERDNVAAYLPADYSVIYEEPHPDNSDRRHWMSVVIAGRDSHGWTLDGYVLPRLASGGMPGHEIDLSHDVMTRIPNDLPPDVEADVRRILRSELRRRRAARLEARRKPDHD